MSHFDTLLGQFLGGNGGGGIEKLGTFNLGEVSTDNPNAQPLKNIDTNVPFEDGLYLAVIKSDQESGLQGSYNLISISENGEMYPNDTVQVGRVAETILDGVKTIVSSLNYSGVYVKSVNNANNKLSLSIYTRCNSPITGEINGNYGLTLYKLAVDTI